MNETALEIIKVLGWFFGGGLTGLGGAWAVLVKARAEAAKVAQDVKKETLDQAGEFSDRLLRYQDNMRAEMLGVYEHLRQCHEVESDQEGHIRYIEEKCGIPEGQRYRKRERTQPVASEFLKTPLAGADSVEFLRRTNEQDALALRKAAELRKDPDTLPHAGGAP